MAEDGTYTLPRTTHEPENEYLDLRGTGSEEATVNTRHIQEAENEYLDLQITGSEEVSVNTNNGKVRFDNGHRSGGPWVNQSKEAYSRSVENTTSKKLQEPLPRQTFYIFLFGGILVFIVGLLLGILIGYFAIKIHGHVESKNTRSVNDGNNLGLAGFSIGGEIDVATQYPIQTVAITTVAQNTRAAIPSTISPPSSTGAAENPTPTPACVCPTQPTVTSTSVPCNVCKRVSPYVTGDETVKSIFEPLTGDETDKVIDKLRADGIVKRRSSLETNHISYIYLFPVEKSLALEYLDNNGPYPKRFAKVHVMRGAVIPPDVMIYKVGPVNETLDNMIVEKQVKDGEIHFNRRSYDTTENSAIATLMRQAVLPIGYILRESFDGADFGRGISAGRPGLYSLDENDRRTACYLYLHMATGGSTLRVLPVSFIIHHPGINTSAWYTSDFYYLNQGPFDSAMDLSQAYRNNSLRKFTLPRGYLRAFSEEYSLKRNQSLPMRPFSDLQPPRTYEPEGPRYRINKGVVFWMDWQCEFSVHPFKGPAIYNIKFKGKRIAYEISQQDITLVYASGTTGAGVAPAVISDTEFSLGNAIRSSRSGFGCPDRASYLRLNVTNVLRTTEKEVACVFEADAQRPMWRHYDNGLLDHHLVIRTPMNLGNYDYTLEFRFHLDGRLEALMAASGTLYGSFWDPEDPLLDDDKSSSPFGFRVGNILSGPVHSHDFVFKVDLDILGTKNSFQSINWKGGEVLTALNTQTDIKEKPEFFPFNITRYIETDYLEKEAGLVIDPLNPAYWTIVNENEKNKWGVKRGYRIIPSLSYSEPESFTKHLMLGPWLNMRYHCAITKRKETEQYGTDSLNDIRRPTDPIGGLKNMMNKENVRNEDLVAWINAKFIHAPTSEDVPMTIGVDKGFVLKPFNYFDVTPTFDLPGHYGKGNPYDKIQCYEP